MPREQTDKYPSKHSYKELIAMMKAKKHFPPDEIVSSKPPKTIWGDDTPK